MGTPVGSPSQPQAAAGRPWLSYFRNGADSLLLVRRMKARRVAGRLLPARTVRRHSQNLRDAASQLEGRFLSLAESFEVLTGQTGELSKATSALVRLAAGEQTSPDDTGSQETSVFESAIAAIEPALASNRDYLETATELSRDLQLIERRISRLDVDKTTLERSIAPLAILQTMFRIECATAPPGIQALFAAISDEIGRTRVQIATHITQEFQALDEARRGITQIVGRLRQGNHARQSAACRGETIAAGFAQIREELGVRNSSRQRLAELGAQVSGYVAQVVNTMQYQDILNQKIQHVACGLDVLAEHCGSRAKSARNSELDSLLLIRDGAKLEAAHLEEVERVFTRAGKGLEESLEGMVNCLADFGEECSRISEAVGSDEDGEEHNEPARVRVQGLISVLLGAVSDVCGLTVASCAESEEHLSGLAPLASRMSNLTDSVSELASRIRMISLNAQVQAVHAGTGTGLEHLSSRVGLVATEIGETISVISKELDSLGRDLSGCQASVSSVLERNRGVLATFGAADVADKPGEVVREKRRLLEFRSSIAQEHKRVRSLIASIRSTSKCVRSSLHAGLDFVDVIQKARTDLEPITEALRTVLRDRGTSTILARRSALYTAAAEWTTHERALGAQLTNDEEFSAQAGVSPAGTEAMEVVEGSMEFF